MQSVAIGAVVTMASKSAGRRPMDNTTAITQQPRRSARNQKGGNTDSKVTEDEARSLSTLEEDYDIITIEESVKCYKRAYSHFD